MVTLNQVQTGLMKYIDNDVLTHLTGIKKVGLGLYSSLAASNVASTILKYKDHPAVSVLDVMDADGNVDIDKIYQAALPMFSGGEKHSVPIPMIGDLLIDRTDLEKMYRYIKEG